MCSDHSTKTCRPCGIDKPFSCFEKNQRGVFGLGAYCKPCKNMRTQKLREEKRRLEPPFTKICQCPDCGKYTKLAVKRSVNRCDDCAKNAALKSLRESAIKRRELGKVKNWENANKHKLSEYRRRWLAKNPTAAISDRYRRRLNYALANLGVKKLKLSSDFLCCTWTEFALHIERQFLPGMSWENRDQWHLDHLVPISTAKTEADVIELNHFTNLRPMWAKDNLAKGDAIHYLI